MPDPKPRSPRTAHSPNWHKRNVHPHKKAATAAVTLSLKKTGVPPATSPSSRWEKIADLADRYSSASCASRTSRT